MRSPLFTVLSAVLAATLLSACSGLPKSEAGRASLEHSARAAIARFKARDPSMREFFNQGYAYAVFPSVGKGAIGVGGAYGTGVVFEKGEPIGYCDLTQGSIGFQLGGQAYSEIIFFERSSALRHFKSGNLEFAAQASAVAVSAGASADANYENGVVVFTMSTGGLMFEASVGGQKFNYEPK